MAQSPHFRIETYRIFEIIDSAEYLALSDNNKDALRIMLSLGYIDLSEDSSARTKLWNMFDENTDTGAALRDEANRLDCTKVVVPYEPEE